MDDFQPDVIGISIRLVFGDEIDKDAPLGTRHTDLRPRIKEIVDNKDLFRGAVYLSLGLPRSYLQELPEVLRARRGYSVQFNKPSEAWTL